MKKHHILIIVVVLFFILAILVGRSISQSSESKEDESIKREILRQRLSRTQ